MLNLASTGNSPDRSTKSTRSHLNVLPQLVNTGFQVLFHSPPGVLFTFPSQYYALSVTKEYLALEGGPSDFPQGFSCLVVLWILLLPIAFVYGAFTLYGLTSQTVPLTNRFTFAVLNPSMHARWFGLFPFRSPLLWESRLISLPPGTEMFHFPGLASLGLYIQLRMMGHDSHRVSPFRNHRIVGCLAPPRCLSQLTASFIASQRQGIHLLPLISYFSRTLLFPSHSPIQL